MEIDSSTEKLRFGEHMSRVTEKSNKYCIKSTMRKPAGRTEMREEKSVEF